MTSLKPIAKHVKEKGLILMGSCGDLIWDPARDYSKTSKVFLKRLLNGISVYQVEYPYDFHINVNAYDTLEENIGSFSGYMYKIKEQKELENLFSEYEESIKNLKDFITSNERVAHDVERSKELNEKAIKSIKDNTSTISLPLSYIRISNMHTDHNKSKRIYEQTGKSLGEVLFLSLLEEADKNSMEYFNFYTMFTARGKKFVERIQDKYHLPQDMCEGILYPIRKI